MPWHVKNGGIPGIPINAASKRAYRGINTIMLWAAAQSAGYPSGFWATYKQWAETGAQVRKGEKSCPVVFWKMLNDEQDACNVRNARFVARAFHVFNVAQVDGFEAPDAPRLPEPERSERAEAFFTAIGADMRQGGNRAFYSVGSDYIQMPLFVAFAESSMYYSTLAHETIHWTGHVSRCARNLKGRFGTEAYAAEELIAELGAAFLCADLGLTLEPREDHAAYIASWLAKVLKNDKRYVFIAAAHAQRAADFLHSLRPTIRVEVTE